MLVWATSGLFVLSGGLDRHRRAGNARAAFDGMFVDDAFRRFAKVTILLSAAAILVMSEDYMATAQPAAVRVSDAGRAGRCGHDDDGLGRAI